MNEVVLVFEFIGFDGIVICFTGLVFNVWAGIYRWVLILQACFWCVDFGFAVYGLCFILFWLGVLSGLLLYFLLMCLAVRIPAMFRVFGVLCIVGVCLLAGVCCACWFLFWIRLFVFERCCVDFWGLVILRFYLGIVYVAYYLVWFCADCLFGFNRWVLLLVVYLFGSCDCFCFSLSWCWFILDFILLFVVLLGLWFICSICFILLGLFACCFDCCWLSFCWCVGVDVGDVFGYIY